MSSKTKKHRPKS